MKRCKTCVETDTRPTSKFDEDGICTPCKSVSAQANLTIDWEKRKKQLAEVVQWSKENSEGDYDCIIGVSGGKDSTRQSLLAKEWGLNPLLVSCQYPPEQVTERGAKNLANLVELGFDLITVTPAPKTSKKFMKNVYEKNGNLFNATELAILSSLPIMSIAYQIRTVLLGENPSLTFGNDVKSDDYSGNNMRHLHTLQGGDPHNFTTPDMKENELYWYRFPSDEKLKKSDMRIVYQGYFIDDFNDHTNYRISTENGLTDRHGEDAKPENIGGISSFVALDDDFVIVNQMLKYIKWGFGKATQEVGVAVRHNQMSREEGLELVHKYDGKCHRKYILQLCDYLDITEEYFWEIAERHRHKDIFVKDTNGEWVLVEEPNE